MPKTIHRIQPKVYRQRAYGPSIYLLNKQEHFLRPFHLQYTKTRQFTPLSCSSANTTLHTRIQTRTDTKRITKVFPNKFPPSLQLNIPYQPLCTLFLLHMQTRISYIIHKKTYIYESDTHLYTQSTNRQEIIILNSTANSYIILELMIYIFYQSFRSDVSYTVYCSGGKDMVMLQGREGTWNMCAKQLDDNIMLWGKRK